MLDLHYAQAISLERLRKQFGMAFGRRMSEDTFAGIFSRVHARDEIDCGGAGAGADQSRDLRGRDLVASGRRMWWDRVFVGEGAVLYEQATSRAKSMPERVMTEPRPEVRVANLFGSQSVTGRRRKYT